MTLTLLVHLVAQSKGLLICRIKSLNFFCTKCTDMQKQGGYANLLYLGPSSDLRLLSRIPIVIETKNASFSRGFSDFFPLPVPAINSYNFTLTQFICPSA